MDKDSTHREKELFARTRVPFAKSKGEAWAELEARMDGGNRREGSGGRLSSTPVRQLHANRSLWLAAASVALLAAITTFLRLYSVDEHCLPGQQIAVILPDASVIELNAESRVSYHPLWWGFSRKVNISGEAWFEVEKGRRFTVTSSLGQTEVLGTTFNVYARGEDYRVDCHSGKVRVVSAESDESLVLRPGDRAEIVKGEKLEKEHLEDLDALPAWMKNELHFRSVSLREVFDEVERQYAIDIETKGEFSYIYSGTFSTTGSVEDVLKALCRPFDLEYAAQNGKKYIIKAMPMD